MDDIRTFKIKIKKEFSEYEKHKLLTATALSPETDISYEEWLEQRLHMALMDLDSQKQDFIDINNIIANYID